MFDGPLMLQVNWNTVDTIHSKDNKLVMGMKINWVTQNLMTVLENISFTATPGSDAKCLKSFTEPPHVAMCQVL